MGPKWGQFSSQFLTNGGGAVLQFSPSPVAQMGVRFVAHMGANVVKQVRASLVPEKKF